VKKISGKKGAGKKKEKLIRQRSATGGASADSPGKKSALFLNDDVAFRIRFLK